MDGVIDQRYQVSGYHKATGAGAMAESLAPGCMYQLLNFELTVGVAPATAENFTATVDAENGAAYDALLYSKDMAGVTTIAKSFDNPKTRRATDEIDFAWANSDGRTWAIEIEYRRVS